MDLEWNEVGNRVVPIQISALRVSSEWWAIDRFDQLMQPLTEPPKWTFLAYNGYPKEAFVSAPTASSVFNQLKRWLMPDDVLCWWSDDPAATFIFLCKTLIKENPEWPMHIIAPAVRDVLLGQYISAKSIYDCKKLLQINHGIEHCSADDVTLIQTILLSYNISGESILAQPLPKEAYPISIQTVLLLFLNIGSSCFMPTQHISDFGAKSK
jgi:hypothetical protein